MGPNFKMFDVAVELDQRNALTVKLSVFIGSKRESLFGKLTISCSARISFA